MNKVNYGVDDFWGLTEEIKLRGIKNVAIKYIFQNGKEVLGDLMNIDNIPMCGIGKILYVEYKNRIIYTLTYEDKYIELVIKK